MPETLHVHLCRAGFEKECAAEITEHAARAGIAGHVRTRPGDSLALFVPSVVHDRQRTAAVLASTRLVFTRQSFRSTGLLDALPVSDRIAPILEAARELEPPFDDFFVEHADTADGRRLARFCRSLKPPLRAALGQADLLERGAPESSGHRLHLLFLSATSVFPGCSRSDWSSPWPMGIPRLKQPRGAPSRSALKLEEALLVMVPARVREELLRPGAAAIDLGASPGGWSFVLARRGMHVIAVDNGPIERRIADDLSVEHRREDGFHFRPDRPVDLLTCDIAASPPRVARLLARWFSGLLCRACVFNLKLPMRRRYQAVQECQSILRESLDARGMAYHLAFKHLYHDREEVTGFFLRRD